MVPHDRTNMLRQVRRDYARCATLSTEYRRKHMEVVKLYAMVKKLHTLYTRSQRQDAPGQLNAQLHELQDIIQRSQILSDEELQRYKDRQKVIMQEYDTMTDAMRVTVESDPDLQSIDATLQQEMHDLQTSAASAARVVDAPPLTDRSMASHVIVEHRSDVLIPTNFDDAELMNDGPAAEHAPASGDVDVVAEPAAAISQLDQLYPAYDARWKLLESNFPATPSLRDMLSTRQWDAETAEIQFQAVKCVPQPGPTPMTADSVRIAVRPLHTLKQSCEAYLTALFVYTAAPDTLSVPVAPDTAGAPSAAGANEGAAPTTVVVSRDHWVLRFIDPSQVDSTSIKAIDHALAQIGQWASGIAEEMPPYVSACDINAADVRERSARTHTHLCCVLDACDAAAPCPYIALPTNWISDASIKNDVLTRWRKRLTAILHMRHHDTGDTPAPPSLRTWLQAWWLSLAVPTLHPYMHDFPTHDQDSRRNLRHVLGLDRWEDGASLTSADVAKLMMTARTYDTQGMLYELLRRNLNLHPSRMHTPQTVTSSTPVADVTDGTCTSLYQAVQLIFVGLRVITDEDPIRAIMRKLRRIDAHQRWLWLWRWQTEMPSCSAMLLVGLEAMMQRLEGSVNHRAHVDCCIYNVQCHTMDNHGGDGSGSALAKSSDMRTVVENRLAAFATATQQHVSHDKPTSRIVCRIAQGASGSMPQTIEHMMFGRDPLNEMMYMPLDASSLRMIAFENVAPYNFSARIDQKGMYRFQYQRKDRHYTTSTDASIVISVFNIDDGAARTVYIKNGYTKRIVQVTPPANSPDVTLVAKHVNVSTHTTTVTEHTLSDDDTHTFTISWSLNRTEFHQYEFYMLTKDGTYVDPTQLRIQCKASNGVSYYDLSDPEVFDGDERPTWFSSVGGARRRAGTRRRRRRRRRHQDRLRSHRARWQRGGGGRRRSQRLHPRRKRRGGTVCNQRLSRYHRTGKSKIPQSK